MKPRSMVTAWTFLCLFAAASITGSAQWWGSGRWAAPAVNLSDEQMAKIEQVRLAFQEKILPIQTQRQRARLRLDSMTMRGAGQKELDAAWDEMEKAEAALEKAFQAHREEIRGFLTEDQRGQFDRYGGLGLGLGWDLGMAPRWGLRMGGGRGYGGGYGAAWGAVPGWGMGFGRGRGGMGRGYYCPWLYWR